MKKKPTDGPEKLSDVIGRLIIARGWGRNAERARLEGAWQAAATDIAVAETRVMSLRRGVLEVEVRSPILLQELAQFHKRRLLASLRQMLPSITLSDLKFKSGTW
ncbi:hypothetical protein BH11PLA2_BH11PLA2_08670 [soil metagenome]